MSAATSGDLVVAHVAALRLGLVVVPVNGAYRAREIGHIVGDCAPAAAVVDDAERGEIITAASAAPVLVVSPAVDLPDGPEPALDRSTPDDLALLCYTSGTTGAPKGAMLSHGNTLASCEALRLAWRWDADDRLVLALPLFHVHGLGVGLHGTLLCGASAVLVPRFDAEAVLDAAREQRRDAVLRRAHDVRAPRRVDPRRRAGAAPSVRVRIGATARIVARGTRGRRGRPRARALRHDRDAHERVESVRRRTARRYRRLPAARGRGPPRRRRAIGRDPVARTERVPRLLAS